MVDTYSVDLSRVEYPKNTQAEISKLREKRILELLVQGVDQAVAERLNPNEPWDPIATTIEAIVGAISNYCYLQYYNKEKNLQVVPVEVRKHQGRIGLKLMSLNGTEVKFDKSEMEFLLKVFASDLPPAPVYVYIESALIATKIAQDK